jgi:hypothetical protein
MSDKSVKFVVGGPVQVDAGTYLERPADEELLQACKKGDFAYVLACRQIGKSSLMNETGKKLREEGIRTAVIDLTLIGRAENEGTWYFSLIAELADRLELKIDVNRWWEKQPILSTPTKHFWQFLRDVVLREISEPIVVFVDEIDFTLGLEFTDGFFAAIRAVYQDRVHHEAYKRLTFVLLGMAAPDELIADSRHTPFNIGQGINLRDFTAAECEPFRLALAAAHPRRGSNYFDQIYDWTKGHPYLTQKLCATVLRSAQDHPELVETLVSSLFFAPEARGESNIQFVQTRIIRDPYAQAMLRIYKRVIEAKSAVADDEQSPAINRLKLYGLVVNQNGHLQVRNKIYAQAFDASWADEMLKNVRLGLPEKYTILRRIEQRGFITVHLAQPEGADEVEAVALKVLKVPEEAEANWADWIEQLEQKAQTVAEAKHPNVVDILETGRIDEKTLYIAMTYIAGGNLRDQLKKDPWPRSKAIEIIRQIGAALTHVHAHGIFHLAVNPNDILLDTQPDPPRLVLTDFGLAKCLLEEPRSQLKPDYIKQTHQYIAPEQKRGDRLTPATDVYGLAVTFFEALVGQLPADRQPGEPLPPLSSIDPEIGPHFDHVLCQATAKKPSDRFKTVAEFIEAVEQANEKAEEVERTQREIRAATVIDGVRGYIEKRGYDPERALSMIEAALEIYPDYEHALLLRGRIWYRQGELDKALADYAQAYAQEQDPTSAAGLEYLDVLSQLAGRCWQQKALPEAVKYYETIRQILDEGDEGDESARDIRQTAWSRLVEYHRREAERVYELAASEDVDEAIKLFEQELVALEALKAKSEIKHLRHKFKALQAKKYEEMIAEAQTVIDQFNAQADQARFSNEEIFQHYLTLDEAYQTLLKLEPDNQQWLEKRREKLKERAETRAQFAAYALGQSECDYETALRHYQAILDLETEYPGVVQQLNLNLKEIIANLQVKVDYYGKYDAIRQLIDEGKYARALDRLERDFIQPGNYQYRDVARWLWRLVYQTKNEGKLPPEWEIASIFGALSKRWVGVEQVRLQQLKARLVSWTPDGILTTVDDENKALGDFEAEVESVEALISQAVAYGLAEKPEVGRCRDDLSGVRAQIQSQRQMLYQIGARETAQKVEAWLQKLADFEALLQSDRPVEHIPVFLDRIEVEQQAIETDPTFEALQTLTTTRGKIRQAVDQMKLRIKRRLVRILVEDVGCRDEELVRMGKEVTRAKEELVQVRGELTEAQKELIDLRPVQQKLKKLDRRHTINKWAFPIALALAVVSGIIIAPLIGLSPLMTIAWALLIVTVVYYIWGYYLN